MNPRSFLAVIPALALAFACSVEDEGTASRETGAENPAIDALFAHWDVPGSPGCAIAVSQHGEMLYSRGYGHANLDYDIPNTPQTVFDIASITKQFIAASLVMLEMEGKLSLDDNVRQWLPELPEYEWPITLNHMIYHVSGLRDYLNLFPLSGRSDYYPISRQQIIEMMSRQRALAFPPGEQYQYSNTAYMLLAGVVERASGQPLGEFMQQRIFTSLGMEGTYLYDDFEEIMPHRATGYSREDDGKVRMVHNYNFDVVGDGQMYSTMEDLLTWNNHLLGPEKPEYHAIMMQEGRLNDGTATRRAKGLFLDEYRGLETIHHTGGSWGTLSVIKRFVEPGLAIAIACNDQNSYPRRLAFRVADHYLADQLGPEPGESDSGNATEAETQPEVPSPSVVELAEFAGEFFSQELDATYRLAVVDAGLMLRIEQEAPSGVVPAAPDTFEFSFHPQGWGGPSRVTLEFNRGPDGSVNGFDLSSGSERGIVFEKQ